MGLWLPERAADFEAIARELTQEDDRLTLTWEIDRRYDAKVYRVLCDVAGDRPPVCIVEWRDELGRPLPLSTGIIWRVRSQRARGGVAAQEAFADNEAMQAAIDREADEAMDEIAADLGPKISDKRSALLHRGQHLRQARDKRRARGENV